MTTISGRLCLLDPLCPLTALSRMQLFAVSPTRPFALAPYFCGVRLIVVINFA